MKAAIRREVPPQTSSSRATRSTRRAFRVLTIAPTSFFGDYGCHVRILEETLALQALGSRVAVCTYRGGRDLPQIDVRRALPLPGFSGVMIGSSRSKPFLDALLLLKSLQVGLSLRPDVVHGHLHEGALVGYIVSRLLRAPFVFDFQGSLTSEMIDHDFLRRDGAIYRPLYWLEGMLDRRSDVVLTSTSHSASLLIREFGCSPDRVRSLPDAVNTDRFAPRWTIAATATERLRLRLGIPEGRRLIVYLGLLAEYQGASHLLRAAVRVVEQCPLAHFVLMGYPGQERYRALAESLGIGEHVTFTGRLPYEDAPLHLAIGEIAVAPKISATEGNGKLLNYMAVGLPTVVFDTPVNREILGDLGEYAFPGDHESLAQKVLGMLENPGPAAERGRRLRQRVVECFSWAHVGERILDIYETLVS